MYKSPCHTRWTHKQASVPSGATGLSLATPALWALMTSAITPFQLTPSSLPLLLTPRTLHRGQERCCSLFSWGFGAFGHFLATFTVLGDLREHHQGATAQGVAIGPLDSFCRPLKSLDTGTLTEILITSSFFCTKTEYTCIITPRPANNYPMQYHDCSGSLIGRTCSLSDYNPPPFLLPR